MRRTVFLALALAGLAAAAPPAHGATRFRALYDEYRRSGLISGCAHSEAELQAALTSIPADIQAYDPAFSDALNTALENRAAGCAAPPPAPAGTGTGATASDGSPGPQSPALPRARAPAPSAPSALPLQLLFLGAFAAAALFAAAILIRRGRRPNGSGPRAGPVGGFVADIAFVARRRLRP